MRGRHRLCCCVVAATRFKPPLGTCCRRLRATDRSLHLSSKAVGAQRISRSGHLALSSPPTTLEHLRIDRADLLGFSNGGTIALHVAMRRPQLVRRLIVITALMKRSWADSQFWESMKTARPEVMPRELRDAYIEVSPHPENFELFFYKARDRMRNFQDAPEDAIRTIAAPTLVVGSDRDVMRPEGAVELFRLLPHAQLAILPRTEHTEITTRTSWLVPMINEFLDAEMPKSM